MDPSGPGGMPAFAGMTGFVRAWWFLTLQGPDGCLLSQA